jgi:cyclophilin family peptidyl-prolyl cis-trans isomerase
MNLNPIKFITKSINKSKLKSKSKTKSVYDEQHTSTESQFNNIFENYIQSKPHIRQSVFIDINIGDEFIGQVQIELFDDIVPYTCKNFIYMIQNHYKESIFHRIINNFMIQGGDYINSNGTGSNSIFGEKFPDENFNSKHDEPYLLSMANAGPNTNGCQFFITLDSLPSLDNKHVVFGRLIDDESKQIINRLALVEIDENDRPKLECKIINCGLL